MKTVTLTFEKALKRQTQLVDLCKTQGTKFSTSPSMSNWEKLLEYEEELLRLNTAILYSNATLKNNSRIKQRELLVRELDVLNKTDKEEEKRKKKFTLANFTRWLRAKDADTNKLREEILLRIQTITDELTKFNTENKISY